MKTQYITYIILWSLYAIVAGFIFWAINYSEWVIENLDLSWFEFYFFSLVMIGCSGAGIYKVVEKSKKLKRYLTYKN